MFDYEPEFLTTSDSKELMNRLRTQATWVREDFKIYGRTFSAPRGTAWFGDRGASYRYTGIEHKGEGWPKLLQPLRASVAARLGFTPNFVVLNHYEHGGEHMGWHRDNEQGLEPTIASVSLGGTRRFRIFLGEDSNQAANANDKSKNKASSFELTSGSLCIFDGGLRHQLAKTKRACDPRINLTFRLVA